jgi:hypothetical protein
MVKSWLLEPLGFKEPRRPLLGPARRTTSGAGSENLGSGLGNLSLNPRTGEYLRGSVEHQKVRSGNQGKVPVEALDEYTRRVIHLMGQVIPRTKGNYWLLLPTYILRNTRSP